MRTMILAALFLAASPAVACTIGVASGRATSDGRPLVWKVRDNGAVPDNEVYYNDALTLPFIAVVTADGTPGSPAWMGVNRRGFAIVNADVAALGDPDLILANGEFMRSALGSCRSVAEFMTLLESTNGIRDTHANFAVIDSTGAAWVVEASRDDWWSYDADATDAGFLVRTNFACVDTADAGSHGLPGAERFVREGRLVGELAAAGHLNAPQLARTVARDFSDWASEAVAVPCLECGEPDSLHGWWDTFFSISNWGTVSSAVIQGVASGEAPSTSTMWVQLGNPAATLALPYWPVGPTPAAADGDGTAPLCDVAREIHGSMIYHHHVYPRLVDTFALVDGLGTGLWERYAPVEEAVVAATAQRLTQWRRQAPDDLAVLAFADSLATAALTTLGHVVTESPPAVGGGLILSAHPNPFNPAVTVTASLARPGHARLTAHDVAGRRVAVVLDRHLEAGAHSLTWRAADLPSGVYLLRLEVDGSVTRGQVTMVR